jgi:prepilin-type N-terminal cleavage/methylation domain-containing protein/prepilin-type processing-associated H-X9-DG protein
MEQTPTRRERLSPCGRLPGFTLIEILVVIGIVAVLAALLFPVATGMIGKSHSTHCLSNLRAIGQGIHLYANDNNGDYPDAKWADGAAPSALVTGSGPNGLGFVVAGGYLGNEPVDNPGGENRPKILRCPSKNGKAFFSDPNWSSYAYQSPFPSGSGAARTDIAQRRTAVPSGWAIVMDASQAYAGFPAPHSGETVSVLYADGHSEAKKFIGGAEAPAWGVWLGKFDLSEPRQ